MTDKSQASNVRPERVEELSLELSNALKNDLNSLRIINSKTRLLSVNARIEAANAGGTTGAAFSVIANEVMDLAKNMDLTFRKLEQQTTSLLKELSIIGNRLARDVKGQRLSDLAATHMDLIDRNLYERSCDVRWWATDGGIVKALTSLDMDDLHYASSRMGTILNSYTVYFDLVLCDLQGIIVANGKPSQFKSTGLKVHNSEWFISAQKSLNGTEFGFESVHESNLVKNRRVLVYSAAVRLNGDVHGQPVGVLGVIFDWNALGQTIVENAAIEPHEKHKTSVIIADSDGIMLANHGPLPNTLKLPILNWSERSNEQRFHFIETFAGKKFLVALAKSTGYETYKTGWVSIILQELC